MTPIAKTVGSPWWPVTRGFRLDVSLKMNAADQWGLYCKVVEGKDPEAARESAEALVLRYQGHLSDPKFPSRSDTLRQLERRARTASHSGLRDAHRALERIDEGTFHPSHVNVFHYDDQGNRVGEIEVLTWEEWVQAA